MQPAPRVLVDVSSTQTAEKPRFTVAISEATLRMPTKSNTSTTHACHLACGLSRPAWGEDASLQPGKHTMAANARSRRRAALVAVQHPPRVSFRGRGGGGGYSSLPGWVVWPVPPTRLRDTKDATPRPASAFLFFSGTGIRMRGAPGEAETPWFRGTAARGGGPSGHEKESSWHPASGAFFPAGGRELETSCPRPRRQTRRGNPPPCGLPPEHGTRKRGPSAAPPGLATGVSREVCRRTVTCLSSCRRTGCTVCISGSSSGRQ